MQSQRGLINKDNEPVPANSHRNSGKFPGPFIQRAGRYGSNMSNKNSNVISGNNLIYNSEQKSLKIKIKNAMGTKDRKSADGR